MTKNTFHFIKNSLFKDLMDFLKQVLSKDPLEITKYHIVFPTLRGCQKFQDYFLRHSGLESGFLPRLTSLAEVLKDPYQVDFVPPSSTPALMEFATRLSLGLSITQ